MSSPKTGKPRDKPYTVVSLFSGAMGLDIGLEQTSKFRVRACVEKEAAFCRTIRQNRNDGRLDPDLRIYQSDIAHLSPELVLSDLGLEPGEVDLLVGGPPCQSFSTAGRRRTVQDPRGTLLWQFLRFIDVMRPRFFLMENVRGLNSAALRHRPLAQRPEKGGPPLKSDEEPGSVVKLFAQDIRNLRGASYHMDCFEVNAVNYGAPQLRERALYIGNRFNATVDFPNPTHGNNDNGQADLFTHREDRLQPWRTLRDAIGDLREDFPVIMNFSPRKKRYLEMIPPGSNWRILPKAIQQESMGRAWHAKGGRTGWWRRLTYDLPCPTLVTMPNHAGTSLCHPDHTRALTVREYARIQEFPDDWTICGKTAEQYVQLGNAVPVRLGHVAGEVIAQELESLRERGWMPYPERKEGYRKIYIQAHIRTRQWFKDGRTLVWEDGRNNEHARYSPPKTRRKKTTLQG